jgi:hypothetical protein
VASPRFFLHLDGIRSLERRLATLPTAGGGCGTAKDPGIGPTTAVGGLRAEVSRPIVSAMTDLVVTALSCDLTRVFSFAYTYPAAKITYKTLGLADDDIHGYCHKEAGNQPNVAKAVTYVMGCFAEMLEKMEAIKEGAGTLLDASTVYSTTCCAWGHDHSEKDWPVLVAGRAGGRLKGNLHVRAPGDSTTKVLLTLANLHGAKLATLGKDAAAATQELGAILV